MFNKNLCVRMSGRRVIKLWPQMKGWRTDPQGTWMDGEGEVPGLTAVSFIQSFPTASVTLWRSRSVSTTYVMEAAVPHMQRLWFQVRNHESFGADVQCHSCYCKPPSPRDPRPGTRLSGLRTVRGTGLLEGLYCRLILRSAFHFHF